jgi:Zn-dependent M28 family amino/carboxypeptidase
LENLSGNIHGIAAYEKNAVEKMKPASKEILNSTIRFNIKNQTPEIFRGRNVLGVIEGENRDQILVVGAHYDHKGKFNGFVWNGADDNASGTVAVMTIARACMATGVKPKRTIVFAAWDAEEEGLLGSHYFVMNPVRTDLFANINFDMISRDAEKDSSGVMCDLTYTKAYELLKTATEKDLAYYKIGLKMKYSAEETPSGGSDFNYFAAKKIPVIAYMAAMHKDYHRPADKPYKVNITEDD